MQHEKSCSRLMLRGHAVAHWHTSVLPTGLLLLLEILVVRHLLLLFVGHVAGVHTGGAGHVRLLSGTDIAVVDILGRLCWDLWGVDAILAGGGVWGVEASLTGQIWVNSDLRNKTHLDQVLALRLGDQWLKLRSGKGIDQTGLGHDEQQHLSARKNRQFISLVISAPNQYSE